MMHAMHAPMGQAPPTQTQPPGIVQQNMQQNEIIRQQLAEQETIQRVFAKTFESDLATAMKLLGQGGMMSPRGGGMAGDMTGGIGQAGGIGGP